jgi:hypothetical protein
MDWYGLIDYPLKMITKISKDNQTALNKITLVVVIGDNIDLLGAFSLFSGRDSPLIFGLGTT